MFGESFRYVRHGKFPWINPTFYRSRRVMCKNRGSPGKSHEVMARWTRCHMALDGKLDAPFRDVSALLFVPIVRRFNGSKHFRMTCGICQKSSADDCFKTDFPMPPAAINEMASHAEKRFGYRASDPSAILNLPFQATGKRPS
jgi:hypothetical protein